MGRIRLASVVFLIASALQGQETRGIIAGRVLDSQSAAIADAKVTVTNIDTNVATERTTNSTGYYEANLLLPGVYAITVEVPGFKKSIRSGLILAVGGRLDVDVSLELGALSESVTVTGESPMLDTSVVSSGRLYDQRTLMDLPVMGNNPMLLTKLAPGVAHNGVNRFANQGFTIAASEYYLPGNVGGNEWSIDGAPNNGRERQPAYIPYSDTIQEFKIDTSSFDASFGHSTGINISMMTKSGSNAFHGTATNQYWNSRWNGAPFFVKQLYYRRINEALAAGNEARADQLRSEQKQAGAHSNNYAGTFSGPVWIPKLYDGRNKAFFLVSYSGLKELRIEEATGLNKTIPTASDLAGDFSPWLRVDATRYQVYDPLTIRPDPARATHFIRTPFAGNIVPKSRIINPFYDTYVKLLPAPNSNPLDPRAEPRNNYIAYNQPNNTDYWSFTNRLDYNLSSAHRFFARWSYNKFLEDKFDWTYETARGLMSNDDSRINLGGTLDWTWTRSASTVWNFNLAINNFRQGNLTRTAAKFKPSDLGLPAYMDQKAGEQHTFPTLSMSDYTGIGQNAPAFTSFRTFTPKVGFSQVRGSHSIRAGLEFRGQYRTQTAGGRTSGNFGFNNSFVRRNDDTFTPAGNLGLSWAAFMLGLPNSMSIDTNDSYAMVNPYYGWFAQDTWRLTRNLTVNIGLRMEYEKGPTERYNRMLAGFDYDAKLPITDAAQAAYAARPIAEVPASSFLVRGGSLYAGLNGTPRNLWGGELLWLPRISAGWQFRPSMILRGGYGVYYDTINVLNDGPDQFGFDRATSTTLTNDFGATWLAGDPANGVSPLKDPFPVRSDGTRFNVPFQNALGLMASQGREYTFDGYNALHPRVQRWRLGLQKQLGGNMVIEAAYSGSWGSRLHITQRLDALPEKYWASGLVRNDAVATDLNQNLPNPYNIANFESLKTSHPLVYQQMSTQSFFTSPTIRKSSLLRPYSNIAGNNGLRLSNLAYGNSRSHSLELTFEKRMSRGFNLNASYSWMTSGKRDVTLNEFELPNIWTPTNFGRSHRFAATGIYELPFGPRRQFLTGGLLGYIAGGWQLSATYEWQPGPLLDFGNVFYYGDLEDIPSDSPTLGKWFNTDGFERTPAKGPNSFHRRIFPTRVEGVRADMTNQWNANVLREFRLKESLTLQLRLDALNLQNRAQFSGPVTDPFNTNFGRVTTQTGATNRWLQIQARIRF